MTYRGRVKNGVVVLDRAARLAEGTSVEVRPMPSSNGGADRRKVTPKPGTAAAILPHVGTWAGEPGEVDRLLAELKQMKEAEVAAKRAALSRNGAGGAKVGGSRVKRKSPAGGKRKRRQ